MQAAPFHNGYGMMTMHGTRKPVWRAFQVRFGTAVCAMTWEAERWCATVYWLCRFVLSVVLVGVGGGEGGGAAAAAAATACLLLLPLLPQPSLLVGSEIAANKHSRSTCVACCGCTHRTPHICHTPPPRRPLRHKRSCCTKPVRRATPPRRRKRRTGTRPSLCSPRPLRRPRGTATTTTTTRAPRAPPQAALSISRCACARACSRACVRACERLLALAWPRRSSARALLSCAAVVCSCLLIAVMHRATTLRCCQRR